MQTKEKLSSENNLLKENVDISKPNLKRKLETVDFAQAIEMSLGDKNIESNEEARFKLPRNNSDNVKDNVKIQPSVSTEKLKSNTDNNWTCKSPKIAAKLKSNPEEIFTSKSPAIVGKSPFVSSVAPVENKTLKTVASPSKSIIVAKASGDSDSSDEEDVSAANNSLKSSKHVSFDDDATEGVVVQNTAVSFSNFRTHVDVEKSKTNKSMPTNKAPAVLCC